MTTPHLDVDAVIAGQLPDAAEASALIHRFGDERAHHLTDGSQERTARCDWAIANLLVERHEFDGADRHFDDASKRFADHKLHHHQAGLQWSRVQRYCAEAEAEAEAEADTDRHEALMRHAVDAAVSSYIATEYERFQLTDPVQRRRWESVADGRLAQTLVLAQAHGSDSLVAELIECAINGGVHTVIKSSRSATAETVGPLTEELAQQEIRMLHTANLGEVAVRLGAAARLLDSSHLVVQPPPALLYPSEDDARRVMLGSHRRMAAGLDPDLERILDSVPEVEAW